MRLGGYMLLIQKSDLLVTYFPFCFDFLWGVIFSAMNLRFTNKNWVLINMTHFNLLV